MAPKSDRRGDERLLAMIKARCRGETPDEIARRHGVTPNYVRTTTHLVKAGDLSFSSEPRGLVLSKYWQGAKS